MSSPREIAIQVSLSFTQSHDVSDLVKNAEAILGFLDGSTSSTKQAAEAECRRIDAVMRKAGFNPVTLEFSGDVDAALAVLKEAGLLLEPVRSCTAAPFLPEASA